MLGTKVWGFRSYSGNHVLCTCTMMRCPFLKVYACWCRSTVYDSTAFGGIGVGRSQLLRYRPRMMSPVTIMRGRDRKSTRLNSSHVRISYAVFCLKKKKTKQDFFAVYVYMRAAKRQKYRTD